MTSTVNMITVTVNIIAAAASAIVNGVVAFKLRQPFRNVCLINAALSVVYVGVFIATLFAPTDADVIKAQYFGTGVSMFVWPLVWIAPAMAVHKLTQSDGD